MKKLLSVLTILTLTLGYAQLQVDTTFPSNGKFNDAISKIVKQNDGKTLVLGSFTSYDTTPISQLARLNADGTLDTTFNIGSSVGTSGTINTAKPLSDGKILIGGTFNTFNGTATQNVIRLNSDGSLDTTFETPGFYFTGNYIGSVSTIEVQADGKILVGGWFDKCGTTNRSGIARLNADGTLDTTYDPGLGVNNGVNGSHYVSKIVDMSDGTILVGGRYASFGSVPRTGIARTNSTGGVHTSFSNGTNTDVSSIVIQSDGKVIIAGSFTSVGGTTKNRIARLNSNGTVDTSFLIGTGANGWVRDVQLLPNNKILIAGAFGTINGTTVNQIALLNANGILDTSFNSNSVYLNNINSVYMNDDGKLLVGGNFTDYNNNYSYKYFLQLYDPNFTLSTTEAEATASKLTIYPNPTTDYINLATTDKINGVNIFSASGQLVKQSKDKTIDVSTLKAGKYTIETETSNNKHINHFIKK